MNSADVLTNYQLTKCPSFNSFLDFFSGRRGFISKKIVGDS